MKADKEQFTKWWKDKIDKVNVENALLKQRVDKLEHDMQILVNFIKNTAIQQYNVQQVVQPQVMPQPVYQDLPLKYNVIWVKFDSRTHIINEWYGFDSIKEAAAHCVVKESTVKYTMKHTYKIRGCYTFFNPMEFYADYFSKGVRVLNNDLFDDDYKLKTENK